MSVSVSTIPAAKAKLLALFKEALAAETATEVWAARPNEDHQLAENVYVGGVRGRREFRNVGRQLPNGREEDYTVSVDVEVFREGTDYEGTEARLWQLMALLETSVGENPDLGGLANVSWAIVSDFVQETVTAPEGVLSKCTFGVSVTARV